MSDQYSNPYQPYFQPGQADPNQFGGQQPPWVPPAKSRAGLVMTIAGAILFALLLVGGGAVYALSGGDKPEPKPVGPSATAPSETPSDSPTPSESPESEYDPAEYADSLVNIYLLSADADRRQVVLIDANHKYTCNGKSYYGNDPSAVSVSYCDETDEFFALEASLENTSPAANEGNTIIAVSFYLLADNGVETNKNRVACVSGALVSAAESKGNLLSPKSDLDAYFSSYVTPYKDGYSKGVEACKTY